MPPTSTAPVPLLPLQPLLLSAQRLSNFLFLLVNQELLHRIILIMPLHQILQLPLLLQRRPAHTPQLFLPFCVRATPRLAHNHVPIIRLALREPPQILPPDLALLGILVIPRLIPRVVDADQATANVRAPEVVDGEIRRPLVLVLEPAESLALARLGIARQLEEDGLAKLREDGDDVAFGQLVGQPAEVNVGRVAVVDVPGGVWGAGGKGRVVS